MANFEASAVTPSEEMTLNVAKLLYAREYIYEENWHSNLHTHTHAEMFYIISGKGNFLFEMQTCSVTEGDFLIINSNVKHTEVSSNDAPLRYIVLGIKGIESLYVSEKSDAFVLLRSAEHKNSLLPLLKDTVSEYNSQNPNSELVCNYLLKAILIKLLRKTNIANEPIRNSNKRVSNDCAAIKRYIDVHHKENLTLDDMANYAHISKYYLVHSFKKEYGITPVNYLQFRRIAESKQLLLETRMSTAQIANVLGFSSPSQFCQCFKRLTLVSPSEFRKGDNS